MESARAVKCGMSEVCSTVGCTQGGLFKEVAHRSAAPSASGPPLVEDDAPSGRRPIYIEGEVSALARLLAVCPCAWLPSPVSVAVRLRALIMMKCQGMLRVGSRNAPRTLPHK